MRHNNLKVHPTLNSFTMSLLDVKNNFIRKRITKSLHEGYGGQFLLTDTLTETRNSETFNVTALMQFILIGLVGHTCRQTDNNTVICLGVKPKIN